MDLPLEIIQIISNISNVKTKFNIQLINKYLHQNIMINTFYDNLYFGDRLHKVYEFPITSHKLTVKILKMHPYIKELNLTNNNMINDDDIKYLNNLHTLYANSQISDI